ISIKDLTASGYDIGRDIMGTMTNILLFAYISGSIPILIVYFNNHSPLGFSLSINLSLEIARALAGGIGIVLTIPIGLYVTFFFISQFYRHAFYDCAYDQHRIQSDYFNNHCMHFN